MFGPDPFGGRRPTAEVATAEDDARAMRGEPVRCVPTDARIRAGDEGNASADIGQLIGRPGHKVVSYGAPRVVGVDRAH